jgi:hypothetical protein
MAIVVILFATQNNERTIRRRTRADGHDSRDAIDKAATIHAVRIERVILRVNALLVVAATAGGTT